MTWLGARARAFHPVPATQHRPTKMATAVEDTLTTIEAENELMRAEIAGTCFLAPAGHERCRSMRLFFRCEVAVG